MPTKEAIAGNKITERMLVPHLRRRGGKSVFQILSGEEQIFTGICGEPIEYGQAVHLANDGKLYVADALANKPAFGVANASGEVEQEIPIQFDGLLDQQIVGQIDTGNFVFLRSQGQIGSIERINSGDIIQIIGVKTKENQIYVKIYTPRIIE